MRLRPPAVATWMHGSSTGRTTSTSGRPRALPDDHGPINGKDGVRGFGQDWLDMFDEFKVEPVELIDARRRQGHCGH